MHPDRAVILVVFSQLTACSSAVQPSHVAPVEHPHEVNHHHHVHQSHDGHGESVIKEDHTVRAEFDVSEIAAHQAMAKQMGIEWTPEPDKNFHLSVTLSRISDREVVRDLRVLLSVTDPTGGVTKRVADVMSASGMYHYGIDFDRKVPGTYRAQASFELDGRPHTLDAAVDVR
jgi:hypothetical protein